MTLTSPLRLRTPDDVLAAVPYLLGFHPHDSLVMLTVASAGRALHARVGLGTHHAEHEEVARVLARATVANEVTMVLLVAYASDRAVAERALETTLDRLERDGTEVVLALTADGRRWFDLHAPRGTEAAEGVPYDLASHPITAGAVVEGKAAFASREALEASLVGGDADDLAAVEAAVTIWREQACAGGPQHRRNEARWLRDALPGLVAAPEAAGRADLPAEVAGRVLAAVGDPEVRDVAWGLAHGPVVADHLRLWRELVRRAPVPARASAAAVLAFVAWRSGDGALAWCGVDVALAQEPGHRLALLVADALEAALPPAEWVDLDVDSLPVLAPLPEPG